MPGFDSRTSGWCAHVITTGGNGDAGVLVRCATSAEVTRRSRTAVSVARISTSVFTVDRATGGACAPDARRLLAKTGVESTEFGRMETGGQGEAWFGHRYTTAQIYSHYGTENTY